jgi:formate dehydrogenase subunit gamma
MKTYERFTPIQRFQHALLFSSVILLVLSGLALKFHDSLFGRAVIALEGGILARGLIHRVAAVVLIILSVFHLLRILLSPKANAEFQILRPRARDIADWWGRVRYTIGLAKEPPRVGKYSPGQKFQYWAVGLFAFLMILTGFPLWFQEAAMVFLPKWALDLVRVVHSYEGLLLLLVIVLWHLYNVHLSPGKFLRNRLWLDGRITEEELRSEHPLEYERLEKGR